MAVSTRVIRGRIKSVQSTKKITKAMELVAASKMRRAVNAVLGARPYSTLAWETVRELAGLSEGSLHPLLAKRERVRSVLIIFIASDRGLCGGFNAQIGKHVMNYILEMKRKGIEVEVVTVGKRAQNLARKLGWTVVGTFTGLANNPTVLDVRPIASLMIHDFMKEKYDEVMLAYTHFASSLRQVAQLKQILPLASEGSHENPHVGKGEAPLQSIPEVHPGNLHMRHEDKKSPGNRYEYLFEPTPSVVLDAMLPRLVEGQVYQAILESSASEHAARMMAMRSATDAASDFISDLVFAFNQARQSFITREISEISAGKIALE